MTKHSKTIADLKKPDSFGPPIIGSDFEKICQCLVGKKVTDWKEEDVCAVLNSILPAAHIDGRGSPENRKGALLYAEILESLIDYGRQHPHVLHVLDPYLVVIYHDHGGVLSPQVVDTLADYPHPVVVHNNNNCMYQFIGGVSGFGQASHFLGYLQQADETLRGTVINYTGNPTLL